MAGTRGERQRQQRHALRRFPAVADQLHETVDRSVGGGKRLRHRFGGRPAFTAISGDPLGLVERGGIETGSLGEPGRRQPGAFRETVERGPDLLVSQTARRFGMPGHRPIRLLEWIRYLLLWRTRHRTRRPNLYWPVVLDSSIRKSGLPERYENVGIGRP